MGECYLQGCDGDHPWTPGYPAGCPHAGRPPRQRQGKPLSVEENIHAGEAERQIAGELWEHDQREADEAWEKKRAVMDTRVAILREEYKAYKATGRQQAQDEGKRIVEGIRAAEQHEVRDRVRRLTAKLDR
jgi:hypothetical protein